MFVKQSSNGEYYLATRKKSSGKRNMYKNLFFVKHNGTEGACGGVNGIALPKQFIGKKIMFKVEVVEDVE